MSSGKAVQSNTYKDHNDQWWEDYYKLRPRVPDSYLNRIYSYHRDHGGQFNLVHDVGAGGGQMALLLSREFAQVAVTEPEPTTFATAQRALELRSDLNEKDAVSPFLFYNATAEDDSIHAPSSVDLVFANVMMHWTDTPLAIKAFHKQLRPNGTLFIGAYGVLRLSDPHLQSIWDQIYHNMNEAWFSRLSEEQLQEIKPRQVTVDSAFNNIDLPEDMFRVERTQRIKINCFGDKTALITPLKEDPQYISNIKANETIIEWDEDSEWSFEKSYEDLRAFTASYGIKDNEALVSWWKQLEDAIGGKTVKGW